MITKIEIDELRRINLNLPTDLPAGRQGSPEKTQRTTEKKWSVALYFCLDVAMPKQGREGRVCFSSVALCGHSDFSNRDTTLFSVIIK